MGGKTSGVRRRVTLLAWCLAQVGCLPMLYKGHMVQAADAWSIEVRAITEAIKEVQVSGEPSFAVPPDGYHWVWVFMNVQNAAAIPRTFGYDSCELALDQRKVLPSFAGSVTSLYDNHQETFAPGEQSYRRVIFAYPDGRTPTTFRCGNMRFEIPRAGGAGKGA